MQFPQTYVRRPTRTVMVGDLSIGSAHPIRVQSMTITKTQDVSGTVKEVLDLTRAGCELVRITAPTVKDAEALKSIRDQLRREGCRVPLCADIHFMPAAAMIAADYVEKVRINPGNFADTKRFAVREYTDHEYALELERIYEKMRPLVERLKLNGGALRIGTNHGSLSDRIMNRYGDSPQGMVASAVEFIRICEDLNFRNTVVSMKASNPKIMIEAYRLLAKEMDSLGMDYPFHLGVTEAGDGEDGRIKSAIGIGALLLDGIGDTVRVSLTEDSVYEIPVAQALVKPFNERLADHMKGNEAHYKRDISQFMTRDSEACHISIPDLWCFHGARLLETEKLQTPIHYTMKLEGPYESQLVHAAMVIGSLFVEGLGADFKLNSSVLTEKELQRLEEGIWQGTRRRMTRADFISCPSCGRTLFNLQATTARIKAQLGHLKGLKIAVMGCIVNGPGEMADADFGYVGWGPGHINLYVGKECVKRGIPEADADRELIQLIKDHGKWMEPAELN